MPRPVSAAGSASSKPALKSPLRTATMSLGLLPSLAGGSSEAAAAVPSAVSKMTAQQLRQMQVSEFCEWLRTQTNKHKRPFQEQTILDYAETARGFQNSATATDLAFYAAGSYSLTRPPRTARRLIR